MNTEAKPEKKNFFEVLAQKFKLTKSKVLTSLLASFAFSFFIFIYSTLSVYFSNAQELPFSLGDFLPYYLIAFLAVFLFVFVVLLLTNKLLHRIGFTLTAGLTICAYVQSFITTVTFSGMPGDGMAEPPSKQKMILNLGIWLIALAVFATLAFFRKKAEFIRTVLSFVLIAVTVMQIFSLVPSTFEYMAFSKTENNHTYILTTENQLDLSSDENIVVLVLDSFDREYFLEYIEANPNAMEDFDGFTYYDDNIAFYPRTYPATASMLSGKLNDFSLNRGQFFAQAYGSSPLLQDLKENDYNVNLYLPNYYGYDNANVFFGYADNVSQANGFKVTEKSMLIKRMFFLSSYFWMPEFKKSQKVSSSYFQETGTYISDKPMYTMEPGSDPDFYTRLTTEGLSANEDGKVFTFLQLRGCHPPFAMNENCQQVSTGSVTSLQQTTGAFKIIKEYIDQMKALGIYKNSTIIITGDHAGPHAWTNDLTEYKQAMNTALLVKPKGADDTPFKTSKAPVSQENFLAEIVKSANLKTEHEYGKAYSDISEDANITRNHYFITFTGSKRKDELVTYEVTGDGTDINNWKIVDRKEVGSIYD